MKAKYKITGLFYVYSRLGDLIDGSFFLNKIFEAESIKFAKEKALAYMRARKNRDYGKEAMLEMKKIRIRQYHKLMPISKRKAKSKKGKQPPLFPNL